MDGAQQQAEDSGGILGNKDKAWDKLRILTVAQREGLSTAIGEEQRQRPTFNSDPEGKGEQYKEK